MTPQPSIDMLTVPKIISVFKENDLPFCIWKNIHQRNDMIMGNTDVDIHIPLSSKIKFEQICLTLGGVEGRSPHSNFPGIIHMFFPGKGNIVLHFHVYFEVFTGESHLKDYLFPLSQALLDTRKPIPDLGYIGEPNLLRIIYILRHYLKKSSLLGLIFHMRERSEYTDELALLPKAIVSTQAVDFLSSSYLKALDDRLEKAGVFETWWKGKRLRHRLHGLKRISFLRAVIMSVKVMVHRIINRLILKEVKSLSPIGRFIAITGLDGSGKTTLLENMVQALGKKFTVHKVHLGRPPVTLLTLPIRFALSLRGAFRKSNSSEGVITSTKIGIVGAIRYSALAYERKILARRVLTWVSKGHLVLSDRYPSQTIGKMDSPRIGTKHNSRIIQFLGKFEERQYATILRPDLLLEIRVSLKTAQTRNAARDKVGKETVEELSTRYEENSDLKYSAKKHIIFINEYTLKEATEKIFALMWTLGIR